MGKKSDYEIVKFKNEEFELEINVNPFEETAIKKFISIK